MAQKKYSDNNRRISDMVQELGKVPPQAVDLEEAVLGAIMLEKDAIIEVLDILTPECFYKETHRIIYLAIQTLSR